MSSKPSIATNHYHEDDDVLEKMLAEAQRLAFQMRSASQENLGENKNGAAAKDAEQWSSQLRGKADQTGGHQASPETPHHSRENQVESAIKAARDMELALKAFSGSFSMEMDTPDKAGADSPTPASPEDKPPGDVELKIAQFSAEHGSGSITWEKVESVREEDEDYVAIRDYSSPVKQTTTPDARPSSVGNNGIKWEKVDMPEKHEDDYVPLADYSKPAPRRATPQPIARTRYVRSRKLSRRRKMVRLVAVVALAAAVGLWYYLGVTRTSKPAYEMIREESDQVPEAENVSEAVNNYEIDESEEDFGYLEDDETIEEGDDEANPSVSYAEECSPDDPQCLEAAEAVIGEEGGMANKKQPETTEAEDAHEADADARVDVCSIPFARFISPLCRAVPVANLSIDKVHFVESLLSGMLQ